MDSATKTKLNAGQLQEMASAAFGNDSKITGWTELKDGWFNAAYELALAGGRNVILKVSPPQAAATLTYEKNIMRTEVEALRLVRRMCQVPVPEVYYYDSSRTIAGSEFFFMEKVEGQPYNQLKSALTEEQQYEIEMEIGRYNRMINEVRGKSFGKVVNAASSEAGPSWRSVFGSLIADLLEDGRRLNADLPVSSYKELESVVADRLPALDAVTEPRLVHWDLWNGNVFVKEGKVSAIIDWERALWGDPLFEYYFRRIVSSPGFAEGYGAAFDGFDERERRKLYDLYLDLILYVECFSRNYDNPAHLEWAKGNLLQGWTAFLE